MIRVFLADSQPEIRSALRLMVLDLEMQVVGEASDWASTFALVPECGTDMLLVDWRLVPTDNAYPLTKLREACPAAVVIVLLGQMDARQPAALSAGADALISQGEMPDRVAELLRAAAEGI